VASVCVLSPVLLHQPDAPFIDLNHNTIAGSTLARRRLCCVQGPVDVWTNPEAPSDLNHWVAGHWD
jgi:hypothetical protein